MTWARFDDASASHPKARVAGNEAWALWVAAVVYCNKYLTDGFVPLAALATDCLPEPIPVAKAKKLAERLCEARLRPTGAGLFVRVDGGYMVHDFLDWNDSKEDVEARRKRDRSRKRGKKDSEPDSTDSPPSIPRGIQDGTRTDSGTHGLVWSGTDGLVKDQEGDPNGLPVRSLDPREPFAMNHQWDPGSAVFVGTMVPPEAHAELLPDFRAYWVPRGDVRPGHQWRGSYASWAVGEWRKRKASRPTKPEETSQVQAKPAITLEAFERAQAVQRAALGRATP